MAVLYLRYNVFLRFPHIHHLRLVRHHCNVFSNRVHSRVHKLQQVVVSITHGWTTGSQPTP